MPVLQPETDRRLEFYGRQTLERLICWPAAAVEIRDTDMHEHELKSIQALQDLPILPADDPYAAAITDRAAACEIAEADDLVRLHELLYRDEYRPVAAIRCGCGPETIRVHFELRDRT